MATPAPIIKIGQEPLGETDRRWRNGQKKRGFEPHTEARPVPASVQ